MDSLVLVLSVTLIIWISIDTFNRVDVLADHNYMTFQFWVCMVFIADFFVEMHHSPNRSRFFWKHIFVLIISIPYLNIINVLGVPLNHEALYFIRFIPLARGALAFGIIISYLSSNAVTSLFISYLSIMLLVGYFCSLIFYQREAGVNPEVTSYWNALWWSAMNMSTVGCNISPVTPAGKIVAVILPVSGMIIFPLFTVYLTDYVTRAVKRSKDGDTDLLE